jgi:hypothetical protein
MKEERLVAAWIRYAKQSKPHNHDHDFEAWERLSDITRVQPSHAFDLIMRIIAQTDDKKVIGIVGAGPLEDLLIHHGEQFVDNVLCYARQDEKWRFALGHIWIASAKNITVKNRISDATVLYFPEGTP